MADVTSITIVIGVGGFPTHASLQLNQAGMITHYGFGPTSSAPIWQGRYDSVTLPIGVSPVGYSGQPAREMQFVDAGHYKIHSYTLELSEEASVGVRERIEVASREYQVQNSWYNVPAEKICTDYVYRLVEAAVPGADLSNLDAYPWIAKFQLDQIVKNGGVFSPLQVLDSDPLNPSHGAGIFPPAVNSGLGGLRKDDDPPQWEIELGFLDRFPTEISAPSIAGYRLPYDIMRANTSAADIAEAGGNIAEAIRANQIDFASAAYRADLLRAGQNAQFSATSILNFDVRFGSWSSFFGGASAPADPLIANGVMQDYSFVNGMLLNTQSGQIAFGWQVGFSGSTIDWDSYFANNSAGTVDVTGLNQTSVSSWYNPSIYYTPGNFAGWDNWDNNNSGGFTLETVPTSALPSSSTSPAQGSTSPSSARPRNSRT